MKTTQEKQPEMRQIQNKHSVQSDHKSCSLSNDKQFEFPTSGGSEQFKIDSRLVSGGMKSGSSQFGLFTANSETSTKATITVQIYLNIEFEKPDSTGNVELLKMNDEFPPAQMSIDSMIQTAVLVFNEKLETKHSNVRINPNFHLWNLYMAKKNGKPKQDLPALDRDNLLSESGLIDMFTLDTKISDKLWPVNSQKWIDYKLKEEEGEDYFAEDSNHNTVSNNYNSDSSVLIKKGDWTKQNSQQSTNKTTDIQTKASLTPNVRNSELISSVQKTKKPTKGVNSGCSGLCSFSNSSKNKNK